MEDTQVTDKDLWARGFSDQTVPIMHLMTKRPPELDDVYDAGLRAYEPARRLKLDADVASDNDPVRQVRLDSETRACLTKKYAKATAALAAPDSRMSQ